MGLTEVVYKIRSQHYPLCQYTERAQGAKVLVSQTNYDADHKAGRFLVTLVGPEQPTRDTLQLFDKLFDRHEVVRTAKDTVSLRCSASLERLRDTNSPAAFALEYFGDTAVVQPGVIKQGYWHARLVVTGKVDLADMLGAYERGLHGGQYDDFKLIRIDDYDPEQQITGAFSENLTPKQLEVLKTALALGFYNTPRSVTLDDLSNIFGISKAAVHNRLQAAERKVVSKFFA
ncbi:MAG: helix-turn-helix domain-containing protein [Halobacteriales archaeon]|nr:helix-turn-helix domain-containing protein [Halobacteriales archaeon]